MLPRHCTGRHSPGVYEKAEKSFPLLSLDDNLLEEVHKQVLHAYYVAAEELKKSNIHLQPLRELQARKRNIDDSPTHRAAKTRQ